MNRDGKYVRENFTDSTKAEARRLELENEWLIALGNQPLAIPQVTGLTKAQLHFAECAFKLLAKAEAGDEDIVLAVRSWLKSGRSRSAETEAPKLDEAVSKFNEWLGSKDCDLRPETRRNLTCRLAIFSNSVPNLPIDQINSDTIRDYITKRGLSKRSAINDRMALAKFFSWAIEPSGWITSNPAHKKTRQRRSAKDDSMPGILSFDEAKTLLRAAEKHAGGRLVPYLVLCLFAGMRPSEVKRVTWQNVNLADGEITLEGKHTKTGKGRIIRFNDGPTGQGPFNRAMRAWLTAYKDRPFYATNWRRDIEEVKREAGFGDPSNDSGLRIWTPDVMRHTAISAYFRTTGSFGYAAEMFGNSEPVIRQFYQGRISSQDAAKFYALTPKSVTEAKP